MQLVLRDEYLPLLDLLGSSPKANVSPMGVEEGIGVFRRLRIADRRFCQLWIELLGREQHSKIEIFLEPSVGHVQ